MLKSNIEKHTNFTTIGEIILAADFDVIVLQEAGDNTTDVTTFLDNLGIDTSIYNCEYFDAQKSNNQQDLAIVYKNSITINQIADSTVTELNITTNNEIQY